MLDRREYEERYGEHVGMCKIHGTVLGSCEICEGDAYDENCIGSDDSENMDCAGNCDANLVIDDCGVCG